MIRTRVTWLAGAALMFTGAFAPAAQKTAAPKPASALVVVYKSPT